MRGRIHDFAVKGEGGGGRSAPPLITQYTPLFYCMFVRLSGLLTKLTAFRFTINKENANKKCLFQVPIT